MEDGGWRIETRETLWCIHKAPMSGSKRGIPLITPLNIFKSSQVLSGLPSAVSWFLPYCLGSRTRTRINEVRP